MKDDTRLIQYTNKVFAGLAFEGSPLRTIASLMQQTKEDVDVMIVNIKVTWIGVSAFFRERYSCRTRICTHCWMAEMGNTT